MIAALSLLQPLTRNKRCHMLTLCERIHGSWKFMANVAMLEVINCNEKKILVRFCWFKHHLTGSANTFTLTDTCQHFFLHCYGTSPTWLQFPSNGSKKQSPNVAMFEVINSNEKKILERFCWLKHHQKGSVNTFKLTETSQYFCFIAMVHLQHCSNFLPIPVTNNHQM